MDARSDRFQVDPHEIPPSLQTAWIVHLRWYYDLFNYEYARDALQPPLIELSASETTYGEWNPTTRTITISARHVLAHSWTEVLETLRHEMAHQYVDEVLRVSNAAPHGSDFAEACKILRAEARAAASPEDLEALGQSREERDRLLGRVRELLALAGSPNEHEAASAMRMAQRFLLKYNLSLADIEGRTQEYETRIVGRIAQRIQEYEYTLGHILQNHFFVCTLWSFSYDARSNRQGRVLELSGTKSNLDVAVYVHTYLTRLADSLWLSRRRLSAAERGTKRQYLAGVFRGLYQKLENERKQLKEEQGLVWTGDRDLDAYYRYRNPRVAKSSGSGVTRDRSYFDGVSDGQQITIHRPLGESTNRGRALPG